MQLSVLHLSGLQLDLLLPIAAESGVNKALGGSSSGSGSSMIKEQQQTPLASAKQLLLAHGRSTDPAVATMPLPLLPRLQELHLTDCLISTAGSLAQFSSACCLISLKIADLQLPHTAQQQQGEEQGQQEEDEERQQEWQQMGQALSSLLRCFTQLKQLWVTGVSSVVTAVGLESAAGSLTELLVHPRDADGSESCLPPRLPQLMSLQDLSIVEGDFCPSALADLRSLKKLHLEKCLTSPDLRLGTADGTARGNAGQPDTLLGAVASLTQVSLL